MADTAEPTIRTLSFKEFDAEVERQGIDALDMTGGILVTYHNLEMLVNRRIDDAGAHYSLTLHKLAGACPMDALFASMLKATGKSVNVPSREFVSTAKQALYDLTGAETLAALEQLSHLVHFAERPRPTAQMLEAQHAGRTAEEEARLVRRVELAAIQQHFPHIRHDVDFQNAVLGELHRTKAEQPELDTMAAAAAIKENVAHNSALKDFLPAYDALLAEISRYNKNPFDKRWIKDPSCWEKYVTEQRAKDSGKGIAIAS